MNLKKIPSKMRRAIIFIQTSKTTQLFFHKIVVEMFKAT